MTGDKKAPDAAVVEKAQDKEAAGDDLTQREQAALAAQAAIDAERGYREIAVTHWNGVVTHHFQAIDGLHTSQIETEMIKHVNEQRVNAANPFNQQG